MIDKTAKCFVISNCTASGKIKVCLGDKHSRYILCLHSEEDL